MADLRGRFLDEVWIMQAPAFNYPNESRRRFCADHKLEGMINLRKKRPRSELDLAQAVTSQQQPVRPRPSCKRSQSSRVKCSESAERSLKGS